MTDSPDLADHFPSGNLPESEFSGPLWRLPISLRVIAFGFILIGVLSAVDMLMRALLLSQIFINLGCLLVFVGWGLQKWKESSRDWAVFLTRAALLVIFIWLACALYVVLGGRLPQNLTIGGASVKGMLIGTRVLAYLIWQLRVLKSPDIVWRFKNLELAPRLSRRKRAWWNPLRWQFSLGSLFLATIVLAFVLIQLQTDEFWWRMLPATLTTNSADGCEMRRADYVVATHRLLNRPARLRYVLLTRGDKVGHSLGFASSDSGDVSATVSLPNGDKIAITGDRQLYEINRGKLRRRGERVTMVEFQSYVDSKPAEWGIDALVQYAEKMRAKQPK